MITRQRIARRLLWALELQTLCEVCGTVRFGSPAWDGYLTRIERLTAKIAAA